MEGVRLTTAFNGTACAPFVIPSVPGFPTSPLSLATTYVVLSKENHVQLTEAATLDRKSGVVEGSAVRLSVLPNSSVPNLNPQTELSSRPKRSEVEGPAVPLHPQTNLL